MINLYRFIKRLLTKPKNLRESILVDTNYYGDGLAVWHKNVDFIKDNKFQRSYKIAINSGHLFSLDNNQLQVEWRVKIALWAAEHALKLEGDFVECGVNTGILSLAICNYFNFNDINKHFYLFDTYKGIPILRTNNNIEDTQHIDKKNMFYRDCYEQTKKNFSEWSGVRLVKGIVPDTLETVNIDKVCYLSIDMNVVEPEISALRFFWPRLVSGAVILLDDYGWETCEQQKVAFDAFAKEFQVPILFIPTGQGIIIKP